MLIQFFWGVGMVCFESVQFVCHLGMSHLVILQKFLVVIYPGQMILHTTVDVNFVVSLLFTCTFGTCFVELNATIFTLTKQAEDFVAASYLNFW